MATLNRLRGAVATLLLVLLVAFGMLVTVSAVMFGALLNGHDGLADLLRPLALTIAGWALLATTPAVVALWLRASHPVASGTVASLVGAVLVGLAGPHADGPGDAMLVALGGFLLLVCAVPAPARTQADRFVG